jgi:hypothetical protein
MMVLEKRWRPLRRGLASLPCLTLAGAFMAPDLGAQIPVVNPVVSFGDHTVIASGMTPKGQVVWFGVMRDLDAGTLDWSHDEEITADQGGMGSVQLDIGKPVALQSIWFAVDLATGRFAVNAPAGAITSPSAAACSSRSSSDPESERGLSGQATGPPATPTGLRTARWTSI